MSKIPSTFPREGDARCTDCGHHPSMCCCWGRWDATRVKDQKALAAHPKCNVNLDTLRAKAEAAKAWRPDRRRFCPKSSSVYMDGWGCGCDACLGAQRAVEDIAEHVDDAMRDAKNNVVRPDRPWREAAVRSSERAARIASYFAAEPNPVSEFRDAVKEMTR